MDSIRQAQKRYCTKAMTLAIVAALVFLLLGQNAIAKGLILGTIFSVLNFVLMGETLPLKLGKSRRMSFFWSLLSLLARYALVAIPLITAVRSTRFNLLAVVCGIFLVQAVILAESLLASESSVRNKHAQV